MERIKTYFFFIALTSALLSSMFTFTYLEYYTDYGELIYQFGPDDVCTVSINENLSHFKFINIQSNSMTPTLTSLSVILMADTEVYHIENITEGNIIVFMREGERICHRVIGIQENVFVTKGDANSNPDPNPVPFSDVRGVIIAIF